MKPRLQLPGHDKADRALPRAAILRTRRDGFRNRLDAD